MSDMSPLPKDDPRIIAWEAYRAGDDYQNTRNWALHEKHVDGSLWAAFIAGYAARPTPSIDTVEKVARALQEADLHDGDEGNHYRLFDLLDFSGENKAVMITRQLATAAISALESNATVGWRAALKPFAAAGKRLHNRTDFDDKVIVSIGDVDLTLADFRRAAALAASLVDQGLRS